MRMLSRCSKFDTPIDSLITPTRVHQRLRRACDVATGIAQTRQSGPTRQQDWIIERAGPDGSRLGSCDQLSAFRDVLRTQLAFSSAASIAALSERIAVLS
jgi:hypothetical protein